MWVSSMEKIKLIEPTIEYEKDIWDFRQEILILMIMINLQDAER